MHDKLLRQLNAFKNTPPLWIGKGIGDLLQFDTSTLDYPKILKDSEVQSASSIFVLGKRLEKFFEFGIQNSENIDLLVANLQVSKEKITLGELDYIIKDNATRTVIHIELVYKFYLYDPALSNEISRWIGPNRNDSLLQKVDKLTSKQLPLLYNLQTQKYLEELNLKAESIVQQVCFKAQLFIPKSISKNNYDLVNEECIAGYWITLAEFKTSDYKDSEYFIPLKQDWPIMPIESLEWCSREAIFIQLEELHFRKKSPLIWRKNIKGTFERFFVVWW